MDDLAIPLIWVFSVVIGCFVGAAKGRIGSGMVWSLLFGPVGVIVVLCLPNLAKKVEDAKAQQLLQSQVQIQQAQLRQLQELTDRATAQPIAEPAAVYHVARRGKDLGEMPASKIRQMLRAGTLSKQDHYFDPQMDEWIQIEYLDGMG